MRRLEHELVNALSAAENLDSASEVLEDLLNGGFSVTNDGHLYCTKQLVDRIDGLNIYIYAKDHAPPHFHVRGGGLNAVFLLGTCELIRGEVSPNQLRLIKWWHARSRRLLDKAWERNQAC